MVFSRSFQWVGVALVVGACTEELPRSTDDGGGSSPVGTTNTGPGPSAQGPGPTSASGLTSNGSSQSGGTGGAEPVSPCALEVAAQSPPAIEPDDPQAWELRATEQRGPQPPDPLVALWQLNRSSLWLDVYEPIPNDLEIFVGDCKLRFDGQVTRSSPNNPKQLQSGSRFASVLEPVWSTFQFAPGARYVIEAKSAQSVLARLVFQAPSDFPGLSTATRTSVSWPPFVSGADDPVTLSGFQLTQDGYSNQPPRLVLSTEAGMAIWDASDPIVTHAWVWWPRGLDVQGLPREQSFVSNWYHAL